MKVFKGIRFDQRFLDMLEEIGKLETRTVSNLAKRALIEYIQSHHPHYAQRVQDDEIDTS